ncbi:MAG: alpha/beta fold hydrolase [Gemmatimonadaceae bacterium]|nr:alpha/beta fold hydrolase [Gemmatimonadaceae bacterium]
MSDRPTDITLYTVERDVRALNALRDTLYLKEVHLYGRSLGGMLVEAFMVTNPSGVRSVTSRSRSSRRRSGTPMPTR